MLFFLFHICVAAATPRVVAIGDLHADPIATRDVLIMARIIDEGGAWIAGNTVLVQTGDVTDKGPSSRGVIRILSRLQREAREAGGDVLGVLGNHEVMNLVGDWRGVRPDDIAEYDSKATRMADLRPRGEMGQWIQSNRMVVFIADTVFVHGGISADMASIGRGDLSSIQAKHVGLNHLSPLFGSEGPLWYRGYLLKPEAEACAEIKLALKRLRATRMVMGHTTQKNGQVLSRCDGAIIGIDTGISAYAGHNYAAFELINGDSKAIYPNKTIDLPDPKNTQK